MKVPHILGADLSKNRIDFAIYQGTHLKVSNDLSGFNELLRWLKKKNIDCSQMMIVMEHTGLYSYQLTQFLHKHQIAFSKVSPLAIKRSMGLVRGKNDKIDSMRIARFGFEKQDHLVADKPVTKEMERLQMLHSTRERLVKHRAALRTAVQEYQYNCRLKKSDVIIASHLKLIKDFDGQIAKVEEEIASTAESEKNLKHNFMLLQSVIGVGEVVAMGTLVRTGNFTLFNDARKFACYCGTAPFENSSGTSLRGKTKVSQLADKKMKTLLDLAAKSAIQHDKELREYYLRRIDAGKSTKSTRNIIRNKIILRMFAVIKRQTPFVPNYLHTA